MMKKLLLTFSIILFSAIMAAQIQNEPELLYSGQTVHFKRDFSISAFPDFLFNSPNGNIFAGGLKARVFVGESRINAKAMLSLKIVEFTPKNSISPGVTITLKF